VPITIPVAGDPCGCCGSGNCCQVCDPATDPPNCIRITFSDMVGPVWGDPPPCANAPGPTGPICTDPDVVNFTFLNGLSFKLWRRPTAAAFPTSPTCQAEPLDCPECSGGVYLTNCCPAGPPCLVGECGPTKAWYLCGKNWCDDLPPVCCDAPDPYWNYVSCGTRCLTDPPCIEGDLPGLCDDDVITCDPQPTDATGLIQLSVHLSARCVVPALCGVGDTPAPATPGIMPDVTFSIFTTSILGGSACPGALVVGGSLTLRLSRCQGADMGDGWPSGATAVQATAPAPTCSGGAFVSQLWTFLLEYEYPGLGGTTLTFSGKILVEAVAC
jgi:hypothetical protein